MLRKVAPSHLFLFKVHNRYYGNSGAAAATAAATVGEKSNILSFRSWIARRREQAEKSLVVQVSSKGSCAELRHVAEVISSTPVTRMFHYKLAKPQPQHMVLMEMKHATAVKKILESAIYHDPSNILRLHSQFLWFKIQGANSNTGKIYSDGSGGDDIKSTDILVESTTRRVPFVFKDLHDAQNISEQMELLADQSQLDDFEIRMRFFTARQLEIALRGIFPRLIACPFGSSVNGFGVTGSDLDMVLVHNDDDTSDNNNIINNDDDANSRRSAAVRERFVFQGKTASAEDRLVVQNHLEFIADLLHGFLPGCSQVKRITQARVPIVKYHQEMADMDCDVSLYQSSCLHMSQMLYLVANWDKRVRELSVTVRGWAKATGLTQPSPGRWISNFSLTLLTVFYLQQPEVAVVPPLRRVPRPNFLATDKQFTRYIQQIGLEFVASSLTSEELLRGFFHFYAAFDFKQFGINVLNGKRVVKPDYSAMFIVNPVEPDLNASKNVSAEETDRLAFEMKNAAWLLESECEDTKQWGIIQLLSLNHAYRSNNNYPNSNLSDSGDFKVRSRLVDVKTLFDSSS